jgi:tRNA modification GTPase
VTIREQASLREAWERLGSAGGGMELRAVDLRAALAAVGTVTGRSVSDDLLTRIFGRFCIGK